MRAEQAALTLDPDSAMAHNSVGLMAIDRDDAATAVKAFEQATRLDSGNASYWANLGNARRATGDRAAAEQAYRRALDTDQRTVDAANGLGVLLVEAQRPADAVLLFEQALSSGAGLRGSATQSRHRASERRKIGSRRGTVPPDPGGERSSSREECGRATPWRDGGATVSRWHITAFCFLPVAVILGCKGATTSPPPPTARNLVLITIDTLRADHVGGYGYARARTPMLDGLAAGGALFERAYSAAPITLTSHATLMSGRYPPGHGARDNGMHVSAGVPTLATELHTRGFKTGAFVAAFPLDHQFGLDRGFDVYSDRLPRGPDGRQANERPGSQVADEAIAWLNTVISRQSSVVSRPARPPQPGADQATDQAPSTKHQAPFFLWVHLFEPHAPYGDAASGRPALERYDDEIAVADGAVGRVLSALAPVRARDADHRRRRSRRGVR